MKTLIEAPPGLFFCEGHLEDMRVAQQSADPRYCHGCYQFLKHEVSVLSKNSWLPAWAPRGRKHNQKPSVQNLGEKTSTPYPTHGVVAKGTKQLAFEGLEK